MVIVSFESLQHGVHLISSPTFCAMPLAGLIILLAYLRAPPHDTRYCAADGIPSIHNRIPALGRRVADLGTDAACRVADLVTDANL